MMKTVLVRSGLLMTLIATAANSDTQTKAWQPVGGKMLTEWGAQLNPENAWQEYPRPQMVRKQWRNLNGIWDYAITKNDAAQPTEWKGDILVPFVVEAPLSGVGQLLKTNETLWYHRTFEQLDEPSGRLLLHFEAVDYKTKVWVNDQAVGENIGGNLPFSFDITDAVKTGENKIMVRVLDETGAPKKFQLRGKQAIGNKGIWYTRVSGIWQTVWLEEVPTSYIAGLKTITRMDGTVTIEPTVKGSGTIRCTALFNGKQVAEGKRTLNVTNPKLWSPESPYLYDLKVELIDADGTVADTVDSYFGIREVGKMKDAAGNWRLTLNGETIFHWGPLDQGWWPDGLLTPPSEEAMLSDIKYLQNAGFNMIRKHIKVEPRRYYYHCDKMGMLVWQDHVSGGAKDSKFGEWPLWERMVFPIDPETGNPKVYREMPAESDPRDAVWPDWAHEQFMAELKGMVDHLHNHPSIVVWVPFNERWGQHRTMNVGNWIKAYDPTRTINIASGGNFFPVGDIADAHCYPHPGFEMDNPKYDDFVKVVGEFGGHGWPEEGHLWKITKSNWGYGGLPQSKEEYLERYAESISLLADLKEQGIAAGVYTQTTDVEAEINGLITYDRAVIKILPAQLRKIHQQYGLVE